MTMIYSTNDVLEGKATWALVQANALDMLAALPSNSIDAIITDPPYFLPAVHYSARTKWARSLSDLSIIEHFIGTVMKECRRILKPSGALMMFCDGQSYPVMYVNAYRTYGRITDLVWDKGVIGMGMGVRRQHELILCAIPDSFAWQRWTRSVITSAPVSSEQRVHPAQKPIALMRHLVKLVAPRGSVVVDPFCGSGATGVAALSEGARFIGCDAEPEYVAIGHRHLTATRGSDVDGAAWGPLFETAV